MYIYMCVRVRVCILWGPRELWGLFAGPHKYFALYHDNSPKYLFQTWTSGLCWHIQYSVHNKQETIQRV